MGEAEKKIIPLVMHRVVADGYVENFDDIELSTLWQIAKFCSGNTVDFSASLQFSQGEFLLTFDDGNSSDFDVALPILGSSNCKALFFVSHSMVLVAV